MIPRSDRKPIDVPDDVDQIPVFRSRRKADSLPRLAPADVPEPKGADGFWLRLILQWSALIIVGVIFWVIA